MLRPILQYFEFKEVLKIKTDFRRTNIMSDEKRQKSSLVSHDCVDDGTVRVKDDALRRLSVTHTNIGQQQEGARLATEAEKTMTVRQAIRLYKWAIIYSMAMSLAVVMEG